MTWDTGQLLLPSLLYVSHISRTKEIPETCNMQYIGLSHLAIGLVLCAFSLHSYLRDFDLLLPIGREIWKKGNILNIGMTSYIYIPITKKHIQSVPLATEPGISLIILTPIKILQRILNRSTFVV